MNSTIIAEKKRYPIELYIQIGYFFSISYNLQESLHQEVYKSEKYYYTQHETYYKNIRALGLAYPELDYTISDFFFIAIANLCDRAKIVSNGC